MGLDFSALLELCAASAFGFCSVGSLAWLAGLHAARDKFREKGYLEPPAGSRWFRFLLFKEYDNFEDRGIRFYFGVTHFCLLGLFIVAMAIVVLVGSQLILGGMGGVPEGADEKPN